LGAVVLASWTLSLTTSSSVVPPGLRALDKRDVARQLEQHPELGLRLTLTTLAILIYAGILLSESSNL
jgi:hypothetical protein